MAGESTDTNLNGKMDNVLNKLGEAIDNIVTEFSTNPVRTTIKVLAIIYFIKWVRRALR